MATVSMKCPNCGGELIFDPKSQKYKCEYCGSDFALDEISTEEAATQAVSDVVQEREDTADNHTQQRTAGAEDAAVLYTCPSCGAQIVTDQTTAATFCYYCHNPVLLSEQLSGAFHPDQIIPFEIDRKQAEEHFLDFVQKKKFVPNAFFQKNQIEKLTGIYFPYWVCDAEVEGSLTAEGNKVRVWVSGDEEFTETRIYRMEREGHVSLREITKHALKKTDNLLAEGVLPYDFSKADALWKELLLHQFHDILPGSSIAKVYVDAEKAFHEILDGVAELQADALSELTDQKESQAVTVFNSLSFPRKMLVELPAAFANGAKTVDGTAVQAQKIGDTVKASVEVPSCGAVSLIPAEGQVEEKAVAVEICDGGFTMENSQVKAVVNEKGEVISFVLKESGREFAADAMNRFHLYKDVPRLFDAWDIDSNYIDQEIEAAKNVAVSMEADGLEGVLKVTGEISNSTFTQYIRLAADSRRIEFETEIDWKEMHRLLKTGFPVNVYAENGINEMQFGFVEHPTHRSRAYDKDRFEVCNHRYSALADGAHGAAVLNDCKYGISMNGNALELTLLRAGTCPEMCADNRVHHFTYAFTTWEGSFAESDVVRQGYELNVKPVVAGGAVPTFSALTIDKENVILDTMKPAEDGSGDIILRLYESKKAAVLATVTLSDLLQGEKVYLCDMLENCKEEISVENGEISLNFRAFEVKTVRIKK